MFSYILCCFLVVFAFVNGDDCDSVDCSKAKLPLIDNIKAPLMAEIDVTLINKQIKQYIDDTIKEAMNTVSVDVIDKNDKALREMNESVLNSAESVVAHKLSDFQTKLSGLQEEIRHTKFVGYTAQGGSHGTRTPGTILKFSSMKSSIGLPGNEISVRPNGQFQVPSDGFYFITVSITVKAETSDTSFQIYKNNAVVSGVYYAGRSDTSQHASLLSGTGSIILQLSSGDLIDVRTQSNMFVFDYLSSLTIFKMH